MSKLNELSELFYSYKTFPSEDYKKDSSVKAFKNMYPNDHYSKDLKLFLKKHNYKKEQRGCDLPYWGKKYFSSGKGKKVFIVAQDSQALSAGSVVFYASLFPWVSDIKTSKPETKCFKFDGYKRIYEILKSEWKLDFDYLYITDAKKVYKKGEDKFDLSLCRELLQNEIKICDPDKIILLGYDALSLLLPGKKLNEAIGKPQNCYGYKTAVSYFPVGRGASHYQKRKKEIDKLIVKL
jgi:hypothetical protein